MATTDWLEAEAAPHEAERRGAEVEKLLVEALMGVVGAPRGTRPLAQAEDLELAPRVAAVGGVESGARRLAARRRALEERVLFEPLRGLLDRHLAAVHAD